jgi:glycosyltransferase involved in cell wall biosynthesis
VSATLSARRPGSQALHAEAVTEANPDQALRAPPVRAVTAARRHICLVAPFAWPVFSRDPDTEVIGGAEVQQSILARALAAAGHRVSMICLDFGQPEKVSLDGVTVHRTYRLKAGLPVVRFVAPRITAMWKAMREVDADIYYQRCAGALTAVMAQFCRRHGKRSIFAGASDHDFVPGRQEIRYARDRWLFERGLARVDQIVVQNRTQQRSCREHYGRSSLLIPNCYELPAGSRLGGGDAVLWVGNVRAGKRPEILLDLARRLPHRRFVMVGGAGGHDRTPGGYFDRIRREAAALPNVECTGFLPLSRVEPYFDQARIVVSTALHEGTPNIFLQAWARGVPTVAFFDVAARLHDEPVYRVTANSEQMAEEIERVFDDAAYRARQAARCSHYFAATHSIPQVIGRYERLFAQLSGEAEAMP